MSIFVLLCLLCAVSKIHWEFSGLLYHQSKKKLCNIELQMLKKMVAFLKEKEYYSAADIVPDFHGAARVSQITRVILFLSLFVLPFCLEATALSGFTCSMNTVIIIIIIIYSFMYLHVKPIPS